MIFSDLDKKVQKEILELLHNHIAISSEILKKDRFLMPMMCLPEKNKLIGLQSRDGKIDIEKAYAHAIKTLKKENFSYALFSYSRPLSITTGPIKGVLKTHVFTGNGLDVSFNTYYVVKGMLKNFSIEKSVFNEIKENIFDWYIFIDFKNRHDVVPFLFKPDTANKLTSGISLANFILVASSSKKPKRKASAFLRN